MKLAKLTNFLKKAADLFPLNILLFVLKLAQKILVWILVKIVRFYQYFISPLFPPSCRYYPSCSNYAIEALKVHGALKGSYLAIKRILKCNPYFPGGVDKVPPKKNTKTAEKTCEVNCEKNFENNFQDTKRP